MALFEWQEKNVNMGGCMALASTGVQAPDAVMTFGKFRISNWPFQPSFVVIYHIQNTSILKASFKTP